MYCKTDGTWIYKNKNSDIMICSNCKEEAYWDTDYGQQLFDYCPYCGTRMRKEKDTGCKSVTKKSKTK